MVKLEMIFYKTGYTRIPRVVSITGAYKCWNNETLSFESASSEYLKKNQLLLELKEKYMSVAERWEKEWRNFSVLQWADCFKPKEEEKAKAHKHMTFKEAATLAKSANVKELWLTHYSPSLVRPEEALGEATKIFQNTIAARDRQSVELQFEEE